jgi:uncharacterized integral membrane protein
MPWRLIIFIIIFAISLTFITFNLGNRCDINFGFISFKDVPVFLTAFISFFLGMLCILPFAVARRKRKDRIDKDDEHKPQKPKRKWGKRKEENAPDSPAEGGSPYGID